MTTTNVIEDPAQRTADGKAARRARPRSEHAELDVGRRDPLEILKRQDESRVPELVPIRHGRMLVSPFTFFRGAAAIMAADLARTPTTEFTVQLCGEEKDYERLLEAVENGEVEVEVEEQPS